MRTPNNERLSSDIAEGSGMAGAAPAAARRKACPERSCILTRTAAPQDDLLRLALSPDGEVLPDPRARAPGRGAWLGVDRTALEAAMAKGHLKGALARAFKGATLLVLDDLPDRIEAALTRTLLDRLGIEMRSGHVVLGSDRLQEQARSGKLALLLHAADASEGGRAKLDQAWRVGREAEGSGERGAVMPLDREALSVALGRANVVHLGLTDGKAAGRVRATLQRLMRFKGDP